MEQYKHVVSMADESLHVWECIRCLVPAKFLSELFSNSFDKPQRMAYQIIYNHKQIILDISGWIL